MSAVGGFDGNIPVDELFAAVDEAGLDTVTAADKLISLSFCNSAVPFVFTFSSAAAAAELDSAVACLALLVT